MAPSPRNKDRFNNGGNSQCFAYRLLPLLVYSGFRIKGIRDRGKRKFCLGFFSFFFTEGKKIEAGE